jgi:hypothetical protein
MAIKLIVCIFYRFSNGYLVEFIIKKEEARKKLSDQNNSYYRLLHTNIFDTSIVLLKLVVLNGGCSNVSTAT